ncbi:MAG: trypsin-like peptidase domain-containing protein, partial [Bacillota bacterium]|nr:trypsin-like peptidase domain-containing protein [Bacillota bacterium]
MAAGRRREPDFEALVARLFEALGYRVEVAPGTGGRAADMLVYGPADDRRPRYVVQCKDWYYPVGVRAVRELLAARDRTGAEQGVLAVRGELAPEAERVATELGLVVCRVDPEEPRLEGIPPAGEHFLARGRRAGPPPAAARGRSLDRTVAWPDIEHLEAAAAEPVGGSPAFRAAPRARRGSHRGRALPWRRALWTSLALLAVALALWTWQARPWPSAAWVSSPATGGAPAALSTRATGQAPAAAPDPPTGLTVVAVGDDSVQLSWNDAQGADRYVVLRDGQPVATVRDPRFTDQGLPSDHVFQYAVEAEGAGGVSPPTSPVSVHTTVPWSTLHARYADSVVIVRTYPSWLGPLGGTIGGTGWFAPGGYVVTAWHVVQKAHYVIEVTLQDDGPGSSTGFHGQTYRAHVVAADRAHDLALLALDSGWSGPALPIGDSSRLEPAQPVAILGHPGLEAETLTTGQVLAVHQTYTIQGYGKIQDMFAIDAGSVGGNSGSPVLDHYGRVVGVVEGGMPNNGNQAVAVP